MAGATAFEPEMAQVKVTFTTSEDGFQLPETKRQLLVPAGMAFPSTAQTTSVYTHGAYWLTNNTLNSRHKTSWPLPHSQL